MEERDGTEKGGREGAAVAGEESHTLCAHCFMTYQWNVWNYISLGDTMNYVDVSQIRRHVAFHAEFTHPLVISRVPPT